MKILLAGFNTDRENENKIRTPETISAAYARISRSGLSVEKLREKAASDVKNARKSNSNIIFSLGHSSVAEHAVFNFDLIDISRLAAEYIQHHRIASFTEKSQRYVSFGDNYIIPGEIQNKKDRDKTEKFFKECFQMYDNILRACDRNSIDAYAAKEDARYALPLATKTQMGMTINARTLEYLISDLNSQGIEELGQIAEALYGHVYKLAPSIIKYTESKPLLNKNKKSAQSKRSSAVSLIDYTEHAEEKIISAIVFEQEGVTLSKAKTMAKCGKRRKRILKGIFSNMEMWDRPPRAFEHAYFTFDICLSASAFAQLKRHRMSSITAQGYNTEMKPVIPQTLINTDYGNAYIQLAMKSQELSKYLIRKYGDIGYYVSLNGTRRNVLMTMNARELYHFFRLRSDEHAQWEIRDISDTILKTVKNLYPLLFAYAGGKHRFEEIRSQID